METPLFIKIKPRVHEHPKNTQDRESGESPLTFLYRIDLYICGIPLTDKRKTPMYANTKSIVTASCI